MPVRSGAWALVVLSLGCGSGGRAGKVALADGSPGAGLAVRLVTVDDAGAVITKLGVTTSDARGAFDFDFPADAGANVWAVADAPSGVLRGFWRGTDEGIPVDPRSEGLVAATLAMSGPAGGRGLADFSAAEIRGIANELFAADADGVDLADSASVRTFLEKTVGRALAEAAGGTVATRTTAALEGSPTVGTGSFAADLGVCNTGAPIHVLQGAEFGFDVTGDGSVCGGAHAAADPMLFDALLFALDGAAFSGGAEFPTFSSADLRDGRELRFTAPILEDDGVTPSDVAVTRALRVAPDGDVLRVADIVTNAGTGSRAVAFGVNALLRTGTESALLAYDGEPAALGRAARYAAAYDVHQHRATATFFFRDGLAAAPAALRAPGLALSDPNEVGTAWEIEVGPLETRTVLHYVRLSTARTKAVVAADAAAFLDAPDMAGLGRQELAGLVNFSPARGTVEGEAGSVFGRTRVTAKNRRTGERLRFRARPDGSFAIPLDAQAGDKIDLTADDGLDRTITVD